MPTTKPIRLLWCASDDFTLSVKRHEKPEGGYSNATRIRRCSTTFAGGYTEEYLEPYTDPNLKRIMAARYGRQSDEELVKLLAGYLAEIKAHAGDDSRDWDAFIDRADILSKEFVRRFGPDADPEIVARTMGLSNITICHSTPLENDSIVLKTCETPSGGGLNSANKPRAKRGSRGMSAKTRRKVRSLAVILEERARLDNVSLLTNTIPPTTEDELRRICSDFPQICRVYFQRLSRHLKRAGLSGDYVAVVEIQEKRYQKWGMVVPHLHICFQGRKSRYSEWVLSKTEAAAMWQAVLSHFLGRDLDCSAATRIEKPRKSLKREMGKYLTKGGKLLEQIVKAGKGDFLPSQWNYQSKELGQVEKSRRITLSGDIPGKLWRNLERYQAAGLIWYKAIEIDQIDYVTGKVRKICIGIAGRFCHDWVLPALMRGDDPLRSQSGERHLRVA